MLNSKIANVRHQIDVMIMEGVTPTPAMLRAMRNILVGAEAEANLLLGAQVPVRQRLTPEHMTGGKVVVFPHIPRPGFHPALADDIA